MVADIVPMDELGMSYRSATGYGSFGGTSAPTSGNSSICIRLKDRSLYCLCCDPGLIADSFYCCCICPQQFQPSTKSPERMATTTRTLEKQFFHDEEDILNSQFNLESDHHQPDQVRL